MLELDLTTARYAIQGFGNAGQYAATLHQELLGGTLVAVSDSTGGVYDPQGLDPAAVVRHKQETGRVGDYPGGKPISNEELLELEVEVLYPSALEGVITESNAERIQARVICELASGPTTPAADKILNERPPLCDSRPACQRWRSYGLLPGARAEHVQLLLAFDGHSRGTRSPHH